MSISVVYVYAPHLGGEHEYEYAARFLQTYHMCPTLVPHQNIVVVNSGSQYAADTDGTKLLFSSLPNLTLLQHDNSGYDIGAFQRAAKEIPSDIIVMFGSSAYLKGSGWLERMVDAMQKRGPGIYGSMGNAGMLNMGVFPHVRTTGFWMPTMLMNQYPHRITQASQRYEFEHGRTCITQWCVNRGMGAWIVSWDGEWAHAQWDYIPNGFHRGDQSNMISGDRLSMPPFYHCL